MVIDEFIQKYIKAGGDAYQTEEGTLGSGNWILFDYTGKLKNFIIKEVYVNCWTSAHTIHSYRELPEKYKAILEANY